MIKLEKPQISQEDIIDDCLSNMRDNNSLKKNILASKEEIIKESLIYDEKALEGELSTIKVHSKLKTGATQNDMIKLYKTKFVPKQEMGRKYYSAIKLLAPNHRCPYCGQREVSTLDHYLPKVKYPTYAITPYNLVPSCSECNKTKLDDHCTRREDEIIHPYYDDFVSESWITASIIEQEPIAFEFAVLCPCHWDAVKKKRAQKHFEEFKLNELYKPYASEEFIACFRRIQRLYKRGGKELAIEDLKEQIEDRESIRLNTWQVAMTKALIENEWFWNIYVPKHI